MLNPWEEVPTWMRELCVTTFYMFPVPFTSLRQLPPLLWGTGWKAICEGERLQEKGCPRLWPLRCSPLKLPVPCSTLPAGLQICTHKEFHRKSWHIHHLAIFCTDCLGIRAPFSTKRTWSSSPCTRASRGMVIQWTRWFLQVWVSRSTCILVLHKSVYSPRVTFQVGHHLMEAGCNFFCIYSVLSQLFSWLSC